jgi:hypothetical protein
MNKVLALSILLLLSCYEGAQYMYEYASCDLEMISVSDGSLEPSFYSDTERYTLFLPCSFDSVYITAVPESAEASVFIDGVLLVNGRPQEPVSFSGYKLVEIKVLNNSGDEKSYFIEIIELIEECDTPAPHR